MRHLLITAIVVAAAGALTGCDPDAVTRPDIAPEVTATSASGGGPTLVVDDDGADCPRAEFNGIQAAVIAADPGSTILVCAGVYREQVTITKSGLRLIAKGAPGDVVLDGQNIHSMLAGFLLENAHDNLIEGFLVRRYHEAQIWLRSGSSGNTIRKNLSTESPFHDGIQALNAPGNVIEHNTSFANVSPGLVACGINVIGPGSRDNIVRHNETFANDFGIQVAGGAADNVVFNNESHDNRRFGIRSIGGTTGTVIENNRVLNNTGPGIAVLVFSTGVTVARNQAFGNAPDICWDGVGANDFENNHCRTSAPPGLCEHTEGASTK